MYHGLMTVKPLSPDELYREAIKHIPDGVVEAVNELLVTASYGPQIIIGQDALVNKLEERGFVRNEIFSKGYLNFEDLYREAGWDVFYDRPGFNEFYAPFWRFSRK